MSQGTRNAVAFAEAIEAGCFHLTSSIAAAGLYEGVFREDMFEEAEELDHPYYRTKHESEGIVRRECSRPGGSTGPASWSAIRAPARWTRSTAPTTSSS
jgi:thioester reductase-like protein